MSPGDGLWLAGTAFSDAEEPLEVCAQLGQEGTTFTLRGPLLDLNTPSVKATVF